MKDMFGEEVQDGDFIALQTGDIGFLSKGTDSGNYLFYYLQDGLVASRYLKGDEKFFIYYRSEK